MTRRIWSYVRATLLASLLGAFVVGCGGTNANDQISGSDSGSEITQIEGQITIDGSSTVAPISEAAAEAFEQKFTKVKVTVATSGTGGGFKRFTKGETDISDASRPIKDSEFKSCKEHKVGFIELPVAYDGLTIVVNKDNDFVNELTIDQLKRIFLREGGAKSWQDVDPKWPDLAIKIYAPGTDSGTYDYFFGDVVAKDEENEHPREGMSVNEDDNVLVRGVAGEKGAIGFFGASYYFGNKDKIKAVKIVNPKTKQAVAPTAETIESGEYAPFSRPLFIYVKLDSASRLEVKQFVKFYLENAADLAKKVDYVPLPDSVYDAAKKHFDEQLTGTHFLSKDMKKKTGTLANLYEEDQRVDIE